MKNGIKMLSMCALISSSGAALAYPQYTHQMISEYAAQQSVLDDSSSGVLESLGLGSGVDDDRFLLPSASFILDPYFFPLNVHSTPKWLIQFGAHQEDQFPKSLNHFFDPQQHGAGLEIPGLPLLFDVYPSPNWTLAPVGQIQDQGFSYQDAKNFLIQALTGPSKSDRDQNLGLVFKTLGHVIHHLQDMGQPQHVRNDDHCDISKCKQVLRYRPSDYEKHVFDRGRALPLGGYPVADYATFDTPRKFWEHGGRGIAEFTSHNFVSIHTNFRGTLDDMQADDNHRRPAPSGRAGVNAENIEDLLGSVGPGQPLHGTIWFVSTQVEDLYSPSQSRPNPRASSFSLFESDLRGFGVYPAFSLNRFNYRAAADFLLPRAAAYSTGMLNYFFRGRMEISLPSNGVYSVIDHAVTNAKGAEVPGLGGQGFTQFKVRLRNITPDGIPPGGASPIHQEMSNGKLMAIAKYIVNPCYQPDLLGEYDGNPDFTGIITRNGCTLLEYFGGIEQISISAKKEGQSLDRDVAREFIFDFSAQPIPVNAHDLSIQIVYQGALGAEQDAIVVSGSNVSEPTYISVINGSDYFGIDGQLYTPEEIRENNELRSRVEGVNIDPEFLEDVRILVGGVPAAGSGAAPPKGYHRIAVLADAEVRPPLTGPPNILLEIQSRFRSGNASLGSTIFSVRAARNQLAREPALVSEISIERRGITSRISLYRYKALIGSTVTSEVINALPPMDPGCFNGGNWTCVPEPTAIPLTFP